MPERPAPRAGAASSRHAGRQGSEGYERSRPERKLGGRWRFAGHDFGHDEKCIDLV